MTSEHKTSSFNWGVIIPLIIIFMFLYWSDFKILKQVKSFFVGDDWQLMICETKMGNGIDCQDNSYVIPGYTNKTECMEKGLSIAKKEGFECGKNCKNEHGIIEVCEEVCNKAGCSE